MKKYLYKGPNSSVSLKHEGAADQDVMLWHDRVVELPEDHEYTQTLLAQKLLVDPPAEPEPEPDDAPEADADKTAAVAVIKPQGKKKGSE